MATSTCRAKNPETCRIHGAAGQYSSLEAQADFYSRKGDIASYMAIKQQMENLQDDDETTLIAPDTSDMRIDSWSVSETELSPRTPNNVIAYTLGGMHGFAVYIKSAEKILDQRGYSEREIAAMKHFRFRKDDDFTRDITTGEVLRSVRDYENTHGTALTNGEYENLTVTHFGASFGQVREVTVTKEQALEFLTDAENHVKAKAQESDAG